MEFSRLGEVRSLIPKCVNILALTATATKSTREVVTKLLNVKNPSIISIPPNKDNVIYTVSKNSCMEDVVEKVKDRIISEGINFHKVIIYC